MELKEVLDKIEEILKNRDLDTTSLKEKGENSSGNSVKELVYLLLSFILNILKLPIKLISEFIKEELITTIKKDARLVALISGISGVLFLFFSVLWLFISIAVGAYFIDQGQTLFTSVIYSIVFQVISITIVSIVAFLASKRLSSLTLLKSLAKKVK